MSTTLLRSDSPPETDLPSRLQPLREFVATNELAETVLLRLPAWKTGDGGMAEYQDPESGQVGGRCFRDLGDITPYLWLLDDRREIDQLHRAAEQNTVDGLLVEDGRIRGFDNHDYVLSFYLLYRLTGDEQWREGFLACCAALGRRFFGRSFPPESVRVHGGVSLKRSAFAYGLLELFSLAHGCDPAGGWLDIVAAELPALSRILRRKPVTVLPRTALRIPGCTLFDPRPGNLYARLFKDNSNLAYALFAYSAVADDPEADRLLRSLLAGLHQLFMANDDGWVRTEAHLDGDGLIASNPQLIGNAVAIDLALASSRSPFQKGVLPPETIDPLIAAPIAAMERYGLHRLAPESHIQHLDMITDFTTAGVLWLMERDRPREASALLGQGLSAVERHRTPRGMTTLADDRGPHDAVCIKYNLLMLKLVVCSYLLDQGHQLTPEQRDEITALFLIDR